MDSCKDQRPFEHENKEWWKAIVRLSGTAFQVNQEILFVAQAIDKGPDKRLPEDIENFDQKKEQILF